jgi:hypothetical protein
VVPKGEKTAALAAEGWQGQRQALRLSVSVLRGVALAVVFP